MNAFLSFYEMFSYVLLKIQGLGLGLPIVKSILCMNSGDIKVTSSPNEGSIFTVSLPNA
ncbi:MAG: Histidine kinase, gyrase and HSP90-like ATPase [Anaerocolumna sp.]|nr:Histidine kinase, gyrase and HSP90-like ATPase [Anaerocolumna sp.]